MRRLVLLGAGLALVLTGCGDSTAPQESAVPVGEPGGLALVGGQLIDGTGAPPVADSVVVIRDGRIETAGPRDTTPVPAGAETLDVTGKTIMPGLVNLHVHYRDGPEEIERQFRAQLYYGVTTARSIGSDSPERVAFLLEANTGRPDAPRTYTAGLGFSRPGGFNAAGRNAPETEEEARALVRDQIALGVHFIKMWVNAVAEPGLKIAPDIRTAIIDEALRNGALPVAHIDDEADGRQLVEAGLRDLLHSTVLTFGPGAGVPVDEPDPSPEFIQMCLDNGVSFTPTLSIVQNNWHFAERPELLDDPALRAAFDTYNPEALAGWGRPGTQGGRGRRAWIRGPQGCVSTATGLRQDDARRRGQDCARERCRDGERAVRLGHAPRDGAVCRGRSDPDGCHRRGDGHGRRPDASGGRGRLRHPRGWSGRRPRRAECRSVGRHSEHAGNRPGHATRRVGGPLRHGAGSVANGSGCQTAGRRGSSSIAHETPHGAGSRRRERTVVFVGEQVQEPVGPFANFPDALPELRQHRLAPELLCLLIEHDAL